MMWPDLSVRSCWLLLIVAWGAGLSPAQAQTPASCDTSYVQAEKAYYAADFETAATLLRPCARKPSLPDSTRAQMYRLLSFVYLGQNDPETARRAVESLLDLRPSYTPRPAKDRPDFIALVEKAKAARQKTANTDENDRRWVRWTIGIAAAALGTAAVVLFGGGDSDGGPDPLPPPPSPE
ncbi:MAG: hypothetical protein ABEK75_09410 [Salinibacter sp.]